MTFESGKQKLVMLFHSLINWYSNTIYPIVTRPVFGIMYNSVTKGRQIEITEQ